MTNDQVAIHPRVIKAIEARSSGGSLIKGGMNMNLLVFGIALMVIGAVPAVYLTVMSAP